MLRACFCLASALLAVACGSNDDGPAKPPGHHATTGTGGEGGSGGGGGGSGQGGSVDYCASAAKPIPGCPCDEEGARYDCGKAYANIGNQLVCGPGQMSCGGGKWGECILNNALPAPKP